jgi:hypothetical protein
MLEIGGGHRVVVQPDSPRSARAIRQRSKGWSASGSKEASCAQYSNNRRALLLPQAAWSISARS